MTTRATATAGDAASATTRFTAHQDLALDCAREVERIVAALREQLGGPIKRRGLVVGMSGGLDSSVCAALAVRAVGPRRVLALFMPERHSDPISETIARDWAEQLGIPHRTEAISDALDALGCYARQAEAIRTVVPEFTDAWKFKLVLPGDRLHSDRLNVSALVVQPPGEAERTVRLTADAYRQIVAATNFKQRVRKMMEYHHADRLHYAVVGTPNRLEYDQGFFVKGGDGLADVKPIAHLYKTQVYQLAEYLGVPRAVTDRPPTTDTFSLPARTLDRVLHAHNAGLAPAQAAEVLALSAEEVERAYRDIAQKRMTTRYLHLPPQLVERVPEIDAHLDGAGGAESR